MPPRVPLHFFRVPKRYLTAMSRDVYRSKPAEEIYYYEQTVQRYTRLLTVLARL